MNKTREQFIDNVLANMSLEQKVGQCFTFCWRGSMITPMLLDSIEKLHVGGLRVEPYIVESSRSTYYGEGGLDPNFRAPADYFTIAKTWISPGRPGPIIPPELYAERINRIQQIATSRTGGIPLHLSIDYENAIRNDYEHGGMVAFPPAMGLAYSGDPDLVYRCGKAIGQQLRAIGITMVHSPVLDVTTPENQEIKYRSFSQDPTVVAEMAAQFSKGLIDAGIISTGKHYPGRGNSSKDAHFELEVIESDRAHLDTVELLPYKHLIARGLLGAVMTAHSAYPALDSPAMPATLSRKIITGVLREELGFDGVITSDAMGMGAIIKNWGIPQACVMALKAGVNLLLVKNDNEVREQSFFTVREAVRNGELTEDALDASLRYVLRMKYDQGLFAAKGQVDAAQAPKTIGAPEIGKTSRDAAASALYLMRDSNGLLPLRPDQRILLIEQLRIPVFITNDINYHPNLLGESLLEYSRNILLSDCEFTATPQDTSLLLDLADTADLVVVTNFYWRSGGSNSELVKKLIEGGHRVVVVTNDPSIDGALPEAGTVLCTHGTQPPSLRAAAACLFSATDRSM